MAINSAGAYATAVYNGEDPTYKVLGAAAGSVLGGVIGGKAEKFVGYAGVSAAIARQPELAGYFYRAMPPANGITSSITSELTGKFVENLDKGKK